jgi:general secretion pathway protein D
MKSRNIAWFLYALVMGICLPASISVCMTSTALKKGKRIQGMLTQAPLEQGTTQNLAQEIDTLEQTSAQNPAATNAQNAAQTQPAAISSVTQKPLPEVPVQQKMEEKKQDATQEPSKAADMQTKPAATLSPAAANKHTAHDRFNPEEVPSVEFHFENTDLQNVVNQIGEIFEVTFLTDDIISPQAPNAKTIKGNKVSFKTQRALSKKDAWNLFLSFLDLAGFAIVPQADPKIYKIMPTENAQRSSIRSFIGIDYKSLPNNDEVIRYVYFVENADITVIKGILEALKSTQAPLQILQESKAFIITDKSYNIKSLMQIIRELDKVTMPQALSVLKLRRADADQVKALYATLSNTNDQTNISARLFPARKQPSSLYFPESVSMFTEPRTNSLILLGPQDAITKIEDFIIKYIDVDQDKPYSPLKVYTLKYADADAVANIMNNVTQLGQNTAAGQHGGVRGEDKYLKPMSFTAEKSTNRIIIRGDYDDYLKALEIIKKLDEPQPQVAIEVLLVSLDLNDQRLLGTQLRSKIPETGVNNNPKFQTSGLFGAQIQQNTTATTGAQRLLGNLLTLIGAAPTGSTVVSFGTDAANGVWGVFAALESITNAQVVSNPFLTTVNNKEAQVELGSTRRVVTAEVISGGSSNSSLGDLKAALTVKITPQINSDGMITLKINIQADDFLEPSPTSATTTQRNITTNCIVADKEVLAIGGLIRSKMSDTTTKVPILGDIPILGWLFKNKQKVETKNNILILISTRIVNPESTNLIGQETQEHINEYRHDIDVFEDISGRKDPVNKLFFASDEKDTSQIMNNFLFDRKDNAITEDTLFTKEMSREKRRREARKKKRLAKQRKKEKEALASSAQEEAPKEIGI